MQSGLNIQPKPANALNGSAFGQSILNIGPTQERDDLIFAEFKKYNIPDFFSNFVEVSITEGNNSITYYAAPDVLCIGSNDDYLRVPTMPATSRKIADLYSCVLPTKKMADQIWKAADLKLSPNPMGPPYDADMQTTARFIKHNAMIETQKAGKSFNLINGIKKDIVICKHLLIDPSKVAIYGFFNLNGTPIQGLNPTSHDRSYRDYSHSTRLISRQVKLNGTPTDIYEVLAGNYASLISDEGSYDATKIYT